MKPTRPSEVRALLEELDFRPLKSLGQNFLVDANILAILLDTAAITPTDEILEVGTGLGVLTEPMAAIAKRIVTVEKDRRLCDFLRDRFQRLQNVELICGDMMDVDHEALFRSGISKVVANLPYSVGSAILVNLIQAETPPAQLTVTLQQEVAERLTAKPGHKDFGLLTLWTQLRYDATIRKTVSPTCFYPTPGVKSAILNLVRREQPANDSRDRHFFYALTKFAFARRRKQLKTILCDATIVHSAIARLAGLPIETNLSAEDVLAAFQKLGIEPRLRPEDLSVEMWRRLANVLSHNT